MTPNLDMEIVVLESVLANAKDRYEFEAGLMQAVKLLKESAGYISDVTNKVREIHQVMKRGAATEDHGLDGNLACILDHACSKNDPEPL